MMLTRRRALVSMLAGCQAFVVGAGRAASPNVTPLDRSKLGPIMFREEFGGPISYYDPLSRSGIWKNNYSFGDPRGLSSRVLRNPNVGTNEIMPSRAWCGIDPAHVKDGQGVLEAARLSAEQRRNPRCGGVEFRAALLTTERSFAFRYGYVEMRVKAPTAPGLWPAGWLLCKPVRDLTGRSYDYQDGNGPEWVQGPGNPEIDIFEIMTIDVNTVVQTASMRGSWSEKNRDGSPRIGGAWAPSNLPSDQKVTILKIKVSEFNTYGLLWDKNELRFYINDLETLRCPNRGFHDQMYLLLSMGVGGWKTGAGLNRTRNDFVSAQMLVDYVRVYKI